jgi:hypothetical protein
MSKTPAGTPLATRIQKCIVAHPTWDDHRVAAAMRCHVGDVRAGRAKPAASSAPHPPATPLTKPTVGMSRAEFLAQYDPMTKVLNAMRGAIKIIRAGHYYKDHILRQEAGIHDLVTWRGVSKSPDYEFRKYQFRIKDEIFWTDPASAAAELENNPNAKEV